MSTEEKKGRGRPRRAVEKTTNFTFRITETERRKLNAMAESLGVSPSDILRGVIS